MADQLRLISFFGLFTLFALIEFRRPFRSFNSPRKARWMSHFLLSILNSVSLKAVYGSAAIGAAIWSTEQGIGLFNMVKLPPLLAIVLGIIILDFLIYGQHVVFHKIPFLWRLHRVHHSDSVFDVSTAIRFHTIEILLSMGLKIVSIIVFGLSVWSVLWFEILLNGMALFSHSNFRLPTKLDAVMRRLLVTPSMHRIHHSALQKETDSNYGFNLSIWDRLFRTYTAKPAVSEEKIEIGLTEFRQENQRSLWQLLAQPFRF